MTKVAASVPPLASWSHATVDVPEQGLELVRKAGDAERAEIASALKLSSLDALEARYRIISVAGGGWRLKGQVGAVVVQSCVVTLEPVASTIDEPFEVEFWRETSEPEGGEDKSVLEGPDVETLVGDDIPVGRIVFETLSSAIDPYPRKEGAAFDWKDKTGNAEKANPFSVLAQLKDKE
ncbi:MAG: DUF177 domain-containing protein [Hyphomicrobium sp.]